VDSSKLNAQHNVERFFDVDALPWVDEIGRAAFTDSSGGRRWSALFNIPIVMFVKLDPSRDLPVGFADGARSIQDHRHLSEVLGSGRLVFEVPCLLI
jgi:hypothetical protein